MVVAMGVFMAMIMTMIMTMGLFMVVVMVVVMMDLLTARCSKLKGLRGGKDCKSQEDFHNPPQAGSTAHPQLPAQNSLEPSGRCFQTLYTLPSSSRSGHLLHIQSSAFLLCVTLIAVIWALNLV